jgi:hypothetical protein
LIFHYKHQKQYCYSIFYGLCLIFKQVIGAGTIFATFHGVTTVIANISWAFAIAMEIMLVPVVYALVKKMTKTME